jgi:glycine/D-amino acid oxidase-like deaminating enzyme
MTHKTQIAILGGGIGALTAAFELTEQDPDRNATTSPSILSAGAWGGNAWSAGTSVGIGAHLNMEFMSGPDFTTTHSTSCNGFTLVSNIHQTHGAANSRA